MNGGNTHESDQSNDVLYKRHFALVPKRMRDGKWIWLKSYRKRRSIFD